MKKNKIIFWIATVFLFLFEGMMPLSALIFSPESALGSTLDLGYPAYFGYSLIAFKIAGSIALIIPRLPRAVKEWTYAGFAFDFIFASISHLVVDKNVFFVAMPLIILGILIISYVNYFKIYHRGKVEFQTS
jgi:hypothetical protein